MSQIFPPRFVRGKTPAAFIENNLARVCLIYDEQAALRKFTQQARRARLIARNNSPTNRNSFHPRKCPTILAPPNSKPTRISQLTSTLTSSSKSTPIITNVRVLDSTMTTRYFVKVVSIKVSSSISRIRRINAFEASAGCSHRRRRS